MMTSFKCCCPKYIKGKVLQESCCLKFDNLPKEMNFKVQVLTFSTSSVTQVYTSTGQLNINLSQRY